MAVPTITTTSIPSALTVGDTFDFDIDVSGLGNGAAPSLKDFTVTSFSFNSGIIVATGVTFSTELGTLATPSTQSTTITATSVTFSEVSNLSDAALDASQSDAFTVATISFEAVSPGTVLFQTAPKGSSSFNLTDGGSLVDLPVRFPRGGLVVSAAEQVPEPASSLILLSGLGGLAGLSRRRRANRSSGRGRSAHASGD